MKGLDQSREDNIGFCFQAVGILRCDGVETAAFCGFFRVHYLYDRTHDHLAHIRQWLQAWAQDKVNLLWDMSRTAGDDAFVWHFQEAELFDDVALHRLRARFAESYRALPRRTFP